jgi:hypothetical protein
VGDRSHDGINKLTTKTNISKYTCMTKWWRYNHRAAYIFERSKAKDHENGDETRDLEAAMDPELQRSSSSSMSSDIVLLLYYCTNTCVDYLMNPVTKESHDIRLLDLDVAASF